jgi:hypothetical protein
MTKQARQEEYRKLTTKDRKIAHIVTAHTVQELEEAWEVWEQQGRSKQGLLYGLLLKRKLYLTGELTEEEEELVAQADRNFKEGAKLPPIKGKFNPFNTGG